MLTDAIVLCDGPPGVHLRGVPILSCERVLPAYKVSRTSSGQFSSAPTLRSAYGFLIPRCTDSGSPPKEMAAVFLALPYVVSRFRDRSTYKAARYDGGVCARTPGATAKANENARDRTRDLRVISMDPNLAHVRRQIRVHQRRACRPDRGLTLRCRTLHELSHNRALV